MDGYGICHCPRRNVLSIKIRMTALFFLKLPLVILTLACAVMARGERLSWGQVILSVCLVLILSLLLTVLDLTLLQMTIEQLTKPLAQYI